MMRRAAAALMALLVLAGPVHAGWTPSTIATTWFGEFGAPRLSMQATCRNGGHEAVWVAETGYAFLDIIQVGVVDGELFYAYGSGTPGVPGSTFREVHLGPSGTGPRRYGLALAAHVWTLRIDDRVVARVPDTFRRWRLHQTQVMAEGDLPFGPAACRLPVGRWYAGGYGPQPLTDFGLNWWAIGS